MLIVLVSILSLVGGGLYCIYHCRQRRATYHIVACEDNIASNTLNNTLNDTVNDTVNDTDATTTATNDIKKEDILLSEKNSLEKWTLR